MHMREYKIAAIPGDGIGVEVIAAGLKVLEVLAQRDRGFRLKVEHFPWSSDYYLKHGHYIPEGGLDRLKTFDAIFFGAVGAPNVPDHVSLWGLRLPICQGFDQYANVRPARVLPGITSPLANGNAIDWVIIRENSEGEYSGSGGRAHRGLPEEVATETSIFTRTGVARIHRYAFELAQGRPRKHLTLVTKSNAQRHGMVMWDEIFYEVAKDYPGRRDAARAGGRRDHADGAEAADARHLRRHQPARRHPVRSGRRALGQPRHRADRQPEPGAEISVDVRADPRLGVRHHRQGHRQPGRDLLDRLHDARAPGREGGRGSG